MSELVPYNPEQPEPGKDLVPVEHHMPVPLEQQGDNLPTQSWSSEVEVAEKREQSLSVLNLQIGQVVIKQEVHVHLPESYQPQQTPGPEDTPTADETTVLPQELPRLELSKSINWDAAPKAPETDRERQKRHLYGNGQTDIRTYRSKTDRALDKVTLSKSTRNEGELMRIQSQLRDETLSNRKRDRLSRRAIRLQHRLSGKPGRPSRNAEDYGEQGMIIPAFRREVSHNRKMQRRNKEQEAYKARAKTPRELWQSIRSKGEKKK